MSHKLRIVIDTNVIISAFLKPRSIPRRVLHITLQDHAFLLSVDTLLELKERLLRAKFDQYVSQSIRQEFLQSLPTQATYATVTSTVTDCRDPEDNKFLALALDGHADYIITGDDDLLALHPFRGIQIVTPQAFLQMMPSI